MKEKILIKNDEVRVISPMYSYGADKHLEPRPTELKGLLRNTYRIANPYLDVNSLYKYEVAFFGGQLKVNGESIAKASPMQIYMTEKEKSSDINKIQLLFHRKKSPDPEAYDYGKIFRLKLLINDKPDELISISFLENRDVKQWYTDLFNLSLLIGGIGKRTRRGRGCMTTDELSKISSKDLLQKVTELLNSVCGYDVYNFSKDTVKLAHTEKDTDKQRPYIREIFCGELLLKNKKSVEQYLRKIDWASHYMADKYGNNRATGYCMNGRFASSVIVSLAETKEGIVPVYTILNARYKFENKDEQDIKNEQYEFINIVENEEKIRKIEAGEKI